MSLKEIGQRLRARREERGLTLRDAQIATKIRERYLQALEEGDEAALPGHVYTKGFLRAYANWLGLDGLALVEEYKAALGEDEPVVVAAEPDVERGPAEAAEGPRARRSLGREAAATPVRPRTGRPPATGPLELAAARRRRGNAIVVVLIVLLIAVLAGAYVLYLAAQAKLPEDEPSTAPGQEPVNGGAPVGRDPGTGPSDGATQPPGATGTPPPGNAAPGLGTEGGVGPGAGEDEGTATPTLRREPSGAGVTRYTVIASDIRAEVRVNARCWVRVEADGRLVEERTLEPGMTVTWQASDSLRVRIGYPAGLEVRVHGQIIEFTDVGRVQTLELERES